MQRVTATYGDKVVLRDVDLHIAPGTFNFVIGASGSGKSTFLKLLYRAADVREGTILIDGRPLSSMARHAVRRKMGIIFQSYELLERKTVLENVMMSAWVCGRFDLSVRQEAMELLKRVGLAGRENDDPSTLSGGEQQRVAIARALLNRPSLLLADEPTGNLDEATAESIMELIWKLHQEDGTTVLVVTHSLMLLEKFPADVWEIVQGRLRRRETV